MGASLYTIPRFKGASSACPEAAHDQAQQQRRGRLEEAPSSSRSLTPDPSPALPTLMWKEGRPTTCLARLPLPLLQ